MSESSPVAALPPEIRSGKPIILDWDGVRVVFVAGRFFKMSGTDLLCCGWRADDGNPDNEWTPVDEESPMVNKARSMLGVA
jgi:hypothetical protein